VLLTSGYSVAAGGIPSESKDLRYLQVPYSLTTLAQVVRRYWRRRPSPTSRA